MLLILNTIIDIQNIKKFSNEVFPKLGLGEYEEKHLADNTIKPEKYSGLIISGSGLSSADGSPADVNLYRLLEYFIKAEKPVLGICWGHQMLARFIGGKEYIRHSPKPEFGWRKVEIIESDTILDGYEKPIFCETHFDEVCKLKDDWKALARTKDCQYQAIRFGKEPVWGVQFHPEAFYNIANMMFQSSIEGYPHIKPFLDTTLDNRDKLKQNQRIFENFRALL